MWTPLREQISQGDIFESIPFPVISFENGQNSVVLRPYRGMLLTYDCEYDKEIVPVALLAQVRLLERLSEGSRSNVRKDKVARQFPLLPAEGLEESFVELGNVASVPKILLQALATKGDRLFSLDDATRLRLQERIGIFYGLGR